MSDKINVNQTLDLKSEVCPYTLIKSKLALAGMEVGEILQVTVSHGPAVENIPRSMEDGGQIILKVEKINATDWQIVIKKCGNMEGHLD